MAETSRGEPSVKTCPADEILARYGEDMIPPDDPAARHIAGCPVCRRRLAELEEGLCFWARRVRAESGVFPGERIKRAVRRKLGKS